MFQAEAQREHLESAAVGHQRAIPGHEAVQAAQIAHRLCSWSQQQVIGIGQKHACTQVVQFSRRDAFDTTGSSDDAEERRFNAAMRGMQHACPRVAVPRLMG